MCTGIAVIEAVAGTAAMGDGAAVTAVIAGTAAMIVAIKTGGASRHLNALIGRMTAEATTAETKMAETTTARTMTAEAIAETIAETMPKTTAGTTGKTTADATMHEAARDPETAAGIIGGTTTATAKTIGERPQALRRRAVDLTCLAVSKVRPRQHLLQRPRLPQ